MGSREPSLHRVATKGLTSEMKRHCADILRAQLAAKFPPRTSQAVKAKAIGIPQGVLSKLLAEKGSLGANTLIALRAFTGLTIDELLGLTPEAERLSPEQLETMLERLLARAKAPPKP